MNILKTYSLSILRNNRIKLSKNDLSSLSVLMNSKIENLIINTEIIQKNNDVDFNLIKLFKFES